MAKVGRNAKCPCGSGRKARDCCRGRARATLPYTREDRELALKTLGAFCRGPLAQAEEAALEIFWEAAGDVAEVADDDLSGDTYAGWLFFDYEIEPLQPPAELLVRQVASLPPGVRRYLEMMAQTRLRAYEIAAVSPGASLTLRDLWSGAETTVREQTASTVLHRWDVVAARIAPVGASGQPEIDHGFLIYPPTARSRLAGLPAELLAANDEMTDDEVERTLPLLLHAIRAQAMSVRPRLTTTDGEELLMCRAVFDVADPERARAALDAADALEPTEGGWTWIQPGPTAKALVLGGIKMAGARLILETMSHERSARGQEMLLQAAGEALRYRMTEQVDPYRAMEGKTPTPPLRGPEVDAAVAEMYRAHYTEWPDVGVPALGGVTPREAAKRPDLQPQLVSLLKDMDVAYERSLAMGEVTYDTSWLWAELGLAGHPDAPGPRE